MPDAILPIFHYINYYQYVLSMTVLYSLILCDYFSIFFIKYFGNIYSIQGNVPTLFFFSNFSIVTVWDRKRCEGRLVDPPVLKYDNTNSCEMLTNGDSQLCWMVELPSEPFTVFLERWRITLLPRYGGDNVSLLDFWT